MLQAGNKTFLTGNRRLFEQRVNNFKRRDTFKMTPTVVGGSILDVIVAANKIRSKKDKAVFDEVHCCETEDGGGDCEENYDNTDGDEFENVQEEVFQIEKVDIVAEPNADHDDNNSVTDDLDDKFQREDVAQIEMNEFGVGDLLKDSCNDEGRILLLKFPKVCIMVSLMFDYVIALHLTLFL
jgi:hypothetical protein